MYVDTYKGKHVGKNS